MSRLRRALALPSLLLPLLTPAPARSGDAPAPPFASMLRPEWTVEPARGGRARVSGYVHNSGINDAANVWLRVERVGDGGRVDATYRGRVVGDVLSGGRLAFEVPVPDAVATYRVRIESADWVKECR